MPESMFGRPLQHLLPSQAPASAGGSSTTPELHTTPVQFAPPQFKDFRFNSIGKQPELLSRISLPHPDSAGYHSPTPSPMSAPPLTFPDDPQSKSSSRPTLYEQLAGSDFSSMRGSSRWNASTSQSNGSLVSRIQRSRSPSNDVANAHVKISGLASPPLRVSIVRHTSEDASLIPPVEVLPQPPASSPPTPTSLAPTLDPVDVHSPAYATPLANTTTIATSRIPTPAVGMDAVSGGPAESLSSLAVVDAVTRDLQPSPFATVGIDSLFTRQERLQSISDKLANLALLPSPPSQSPPPVHSSITPARTDITHSQLNQSQYSSAPIVLRHPYSADQADDRVGSSLDDAQVQTNDSSLALISSPMALTQEFQAQGRVIAAAVQNLNSALNTAHRAQVDSENTLALRMQAFEQQRMAFEQTKRAQEATLQKNFQELEQKREELDAKATMLASLEKENKAREEERKVVLAKRQAQEEEERAANMRRVQELQEQIAIAINELKEVEALQAKLQAEQLTSETAQNDLPTEPQEGMNEEERAVIKSRNDLLCAVKHPRRMYTDKVQKLQEANRILRRLGAERKSREAEEAERRQVEEEERLQAHTQIQQSRQLLDDKQCQLEAERKDHEVKNDREQAQLLAGQQAHAEALAQGFGHTEATNGQTFEHRGHSGEVGTSQQQGIADKIADTARIRVAREGNAVPPEAPNAMNVDSDGRAPALHRTVPSDTYTSSGTPQSKKKDKPISGGVMLAASTLEAGVALLPKPAATSSSSSYIVENAANPAISVSEEGAKRSSFPIQFTPGFGRTPSAEIHQTPDHKSAFPRTPKSQTILDASNRGTQELNIRPVAGVSPTQQNVNLRHLKRFRGRGEENGNGDRSVRTVQMKGGENSLLSPKREEQDDNSLGLVQASLSSDPPASLPPRPTVIPPPRPWMPKKHLGAPSSYPPKSNELPPTMLGAEVTTNEQSRVFSGNALSCQEMDALPLLAPAKTTNSLLGEVHAKLQASESRVDVDEKATKDRGENYDVIPSEPASTTISRVLNEEDPSRSNKRFTDEDRHANDSRRVSERHSPLSLSTAASPTQAHRPIDSWHPQNSAVGSRAEPLRATSPIVGKKRPSEYSDSDYGRRARRKRDDVRVTQDHDHDRVDSYRPHWDRHPDSESDERRTVYRAPASPVDRIRSHPDLSRVAHDNKTHVPEEPTASAARWEHSHRRTENDDTYQRYQSSALAYSPTVERHVDDARVGQTHELAAEERMDSRSDPSLLARMGDTQYFPPRGRGRGEPSRGRGEFGRGRGRGVARGGPPLLKRLTAPPQSLGDRLT